MFHSWLAGTVAGRIRFMHVAKTNRLGSLLERQSINDVCLFSCFGREETYPEATLFLPVCSYCDYSSTNKNNLKLSEQAVSFTFSWRPTRSPEPVRADHRGMWGGHMRARWAGLSPGFLAALCACKTHVLQSIMRSPSNRDQWAAATHAVHAVFLIYTVSIQEVLAASGVAQRGWFKRDEGKHPERIAASSEAGAFRRSVWFGGLKYAQRWQTCGRHERHARLQLQRTHFCQQGNGAKENRFYGTLELRSKCSLRLPSSFL